MFNAIKQTIIFLPILFLLACEGGGDGGGDDSGTTASSTDASLSALTVSAGTISPVFASGTNNYTLTVASAATTVTPTVNQANATVTVNGVAVVSGTASASLPLAVGDTAISIVVTAQDGSTSQTYTVTVSRVISTDASLSALAVSAGAISPVFSSGTNNYTLTVASATTTVTPTVNQANATVTVNGATVISGAASASLPLAVGDTVITVVVTAQDGSTIQNYTVTVSRLNTDASLSALTASAGAISPVFASGISNYTLTAASDTTTITPTVNQANATVTVNGVAVVSGAASASLALAVGNTAISIVVTAQDGSTSQTYTVTVNRVSSVISLELLDPNPFFGNHFGNSVVQLANGNIVVSDPFDSSVVSNSGAVHLYSLFSSTPIASIFGDTENDTLGVSSITVLGNNNYVIASHRDSEGGISNAGSVRLMNGSTGVQIAMLTGDVEGDELGKNGITVLSNNNYVISSGLDDEGGIVDAGSVRLVNGSTGVQIGTTLAGDVELDQLGNSGITALGNSNYVISSKLDDEGGITDAGSVRLVDGSTGVQIGATLAGDMVFDQLGSSGITVLGNNNYVIASSDDDKVSISDAGSVILVNGDTGVQIGVILTGDVASDQLGSSDITALGNNNYVIASQFVNVGSIVNAGLVRLVSGITGIEIGTGLAGDVAFDNLGSEGITALGNNNYVIASGGDDEGGIVDAGSVRLVNGATGEQIGDTLAGDVKFDQLGRNGITALGNNNFVIASQFDDEDGVVNAGSVRLVSGNTGMQIGATLAGDTASDSLGNFGITVLVNNNYVIVSRDDNEAGIAEVGSVRLVGGGTGVQIGATLAGDVAFDKLGSNGITVLDNNNYVVASEFDDEGGISNAGSVRLMNGSTGAAVGAAIVGAVGNDMENVKVLKPVSGDYYILSLPKADKGGQENSGTVRIVVP